MKLYIKTPMSYRYIASFTLSKSNIVAYIVVPLLLMMFHALKGTGIKDDYMCHQKWHNPDIYGFPGVILVQKR